MSLSGGKGSVYSYSEDAGQWKGLKSRSNTCGNSHSSFGYDINFSFFL